MSTNKARSSCDARSCQKTAIGRNQTNKSNQSISKCIKCVSSSLAFVVAISKIEPPRCLTTVKAVSSRRGAKWPQTIQSEAKKRAPQAPLKKRFVKKYPGGKLMQVERLLDACSKIVRARLTLPRKKSDHRGACQVIQFLSSHAAFPPSRNLSSLAFKWVHPSCSISAVQSLRNAV